MAHDHAHSHAHDDAHSHEGDGRGHAHGHGHSHAPAPEDMGRAFAIGVVLNTVFVAVEAGVGLYVGSMALLADAGHNLSDVLSLVLAWGAILLAKRAPTARRTYGMRKATILASLTNAVLLLVAVGAIVGESIHRLMEPAPVASGLVMITAGVGVVINTGTALLFMRGGHDLNVRGAFLHMAADAAVSLIVVIGAIVMSQTGIAWIDPMLGLVIAVVIVWGSWGLLRDSVDLAMDAAPRNIDVAKVREWIAERPGVTEIHDLHVWAMSTTETALTAHLIRPDNADADTFLHEASAGLTKTFGIGHITLQIETCGDHPCHLSDAEAV